MTSQPAASLNCCSSNLVSNRCQLYRWGGDEFLVVFPGADAIQIARRMRLILSTAHPLITSDGNEENLKNAIDAADRAMYADKVARKGSVSQTA